VIVLLGWLLDAAWLFVPLILLGLRTHLFEFLHAPHANFSAYLAYRFQTEALLHGHLSLSPVPLAGTRFQDFSYSAAGGLQQVWGLGVPLLRLPFEALAKLAGQPGFPDRWLWPVFTAAALIFLGISFKRWLAQFYPRLHRRERALLMLGVSLTFTLSPPLVGILQTRMGVYEEAIYFEQLFCWVLIALAFRLTLTASDVWKNQLRSPAIYGFSALCGLSALLRPTATLVAAPLALGVFLAITAGTTWRERYRQALPFWGAFLAGFSGVLATNALRFGSPWSFGHNINWVAHPLNLYVTRFGSITEHVSILDRVQELLGALFFDTKFNQFEFFAPDVIPGQANWVRFREFYFQAFGTSGLVALIVCLITLARRRQSVRMHQALIDASGLAFALVFAFYLYSPALTSRYLGDFSAAFSALVVFSALVWLPRTGAKAIAAALILLTVPAWSLSAPEGLPQSRPVSMNSGHIRQFLAQPSPPSPMREALSCEEAATLSPETNLHAGWLANRGCRVSWVSWLVLQEAPCIEVTYRTPSGQPLELQAKRDRAWLKSVQKTPQPEGKWSERFCEGAPPAHPPRIAQYSIAWGHPHTSEAFPREVIELLQVQTVKTP